MATQVYVSNIETVLPDNAFIYSRTDLKGKITEANRVFADISGYTVDELLGQPHSIVRHPDMPKEAFADLWKSLKAGRPWQGIVKNRRSDGGFYWVVANVSPVREEGRIVGYQSLRQKPSREQIRSAEEAYRHVKSGTHSLRIEEGQAVRTHSPWIQYAFHPSTQFAWASYAALLATCCGVALLLSGTPHPALRIAACLALALNTLGALTVRLYTLPRLQRDLDGMATYLESVLSSGNLNIPFKLDQRGRSGLVARRLALMMSWVMCTVQCVADAVHQVESATGEVLNGIREIDQAASSQNAASASVAAASTELGLTIREMSDNLKTTENAVSESGRRAAEGADLSEQASERITGLAASIKTASAEVEALGASSAEVGQIAGVIREIADQTNLLALNASIEAARAGEAGRGFAVVANEVRNLADRTMKATTNIDALLAKIKEDSDRAIAGMRAGASQVDHGVDLVHQSQKTLDGINTLMADAVRMVSEISTASSQQTEAMNEIGGNISHVAAMTEQSVRVVHQTTNLMGFLERMIGRVHNAVTQYQA